jgi:hypothetical protein
MQHLLVDVRKGIAQKIMGNLQKNKGIYGVKHRSSENQTKRNFEIQKNNRNDILYLKL